MCRVCSRPNVEDASRCANCWANRPEDAELAGLGRRGGAGSADPEVESQPAGAAVGRGVAVVALVAAWFILPNLGVALFQSEPSLDISSSPSGGDWPMYQRDLAHTGAASDGATAPAG